MLVSFAGVEYRLAGDRLIKANVGDTKTENGITYKLNQNHRWETAKEPSNGDASQQIGGLPTIEENPQGWGVPNGAKKLERKIDARLNEYEPEAVRSFESKAKAFIDKIKNIDIKQLASMGDVDAFFHGDIYLEDVKILADNLKKGESKTFKELVDSFEYDELFPSLESSYQRYSNEFNSALKNRQGELRNELQNQEFEKHKDLIDRVAASIKDAEPDMIASFKKEADSLLERIKNLSASDLEEEFRDPEIPLHDDIVVDKIVIPLFETLKEKESEEGANFIDDYIDYSEYAPEFQKVYDQYLSKVEQAVEIREAIAGAAIDVAHDFEITAHEIYGEDPPESFNDWQSKKAEITKARDDLKESYRKDLEDLASEADLDWSELDEEFDRFMDEFGHSDDPDDWDENLKKSIQFSFRGIPVKA